MGVFWDYECIKVVWGILEALDSSLFLGFGFRDYFSIIDV
jgi:hypothetical protein